MVEQSFFNDCNDGYSRGLESHHEWRPQLIRPVAHFDRLPLEIRTEIWEYSLPGPRMLCPGCPPEPEREKYVRRSSLAYGTFVEPASQSHPIRHRTSLYFPKNHQPAKPAALDVCRESRHVALKRYRLCFGTTNIFANLDIDILYFGAPYDGRLGRGGKLWGWVERDTSDVVVYPSPEVTADLQRVTRVAYKYTGGWADYGELPAHRDGNGTLLRKDLEMFKCLEEVLLSHAPEEISNEEKPGYFTFRRLDVREASLNSKTLPSNPGPFVDQHQRSASNRLGDGSLAGESGGSSSADMGHHSNTHRTGNSPELRAERFISSFKTGSTKNVVKELKIPAVYRVIIDRISEISGA